MPVCSADDTLLRALEGLRAQTIPELEIVVVSNGSGNDTLELLRHQHDIVLLDHSHRCMAATLNDGLAAASGDYIAIMDANDVAHPDRMELQASFLDVYSEIGAVGCRVGLGGNREDQAERATFTDWINSMIEPDDIALTRFVASPFIHSSIMYRRDLFEKFGAYRDGPFPEDYELWLRWMANGVKFAKVDEELMTWNARPERQLRDDHRYRVDAFSEIKAEYLAMWLTENNPHHPNVVVWGTETATLERVALLEKHGVCITKHIDLELPSIKCEKEVIRHNDMLQPADCFIVPMVGNLGARENIRAFLQRRGFVEGKHCIFST